MDVGTFTNNGSDNMYVGLKDEGNDRLDAVVNWGDNQVAGTSPNGPDNLRFIFTSTTTALPPGQGDPVSQSNDGLETGRFYPGYDTTFTYQLTNPKDFYGRFGVGDFTASGVNEQPTHKLDVVGNGRFRYLPDSLYIADSLVNRYVMVDSTGVLRWSSVSPAGSVGAHNGTSMSTIDPTNVAFGQNLNEIGNPGQLLSNREVPMNGYNIVFTDNASTTYGNNEIGIGTSSPQAKLHVNLNTNIASPSLTRGALVENHSNSASGKGVRVFMSNHNTASYGMQADIDASTNTTSSNFGLRSYIDGGNQNFGVYTEIIGGKTTNIGVSSSATSLAGANVVRGVSSSARGGQINHGGKFNAYGENSTINNYGIQVDASGPSQYSYGIHARTSPLSGTVANFAGYFQGDMHVTGVLSTTSGSVTTSDQMFKTNINNLSNATTLINQLTPRTFDYDTTNFSDFNFESDNQMGLIAQEVEAVIPTIVSSHIRPAQYDSLGNVTAPEISYKGIEYEELIPLLIAGMQEQQVAIEATQSENDSLEQIVTGLNDRLTQLENCLSAILPALCQMNSMSVESTPEAVQERLQTIIDVELSDKNNIVLNQNVPNPFAERTVITFSIPESVQKAQIHFYDGMGKLINTVDVEDRGNGQINVYANDLSTGVYTYSLVADGKIVATKRMMKQ